MTSLISGLLALFFLMLAGSMVRARTWLAGTTLTAVTPWGGLGNLFWALACLWKIRHPHGPTSDNDVLWYLGGVCCLCGLVVVLGARRPGNDAWNLFICIPLAIVLAWPIFVQLRFPWVGAPLRLDAPALLAGVVVMLMAIGNYLGAAVTGPALLMLLGLGVLGASMSTTWVRLPPQWPWRDMVVSVCLIGAMTWGWVIAYRRQHVPPGLERAWLDFRDLFGLVWASRERDRLADLARQQHWPVRFELTGVVPHQTDPSRETSFTSETTTGSAAASTVDVAGSLRWRLSRFVSPAWLDRRLNPPVSST